MQHRVGVVAAGALAVLAVAVPARAGEWSGSYVGAFAGVASGSSSATTVVACDAGGLLCAPSVQEDNGALIGDTASGRSTGTGFAGGGFAGHNWQSGNFVYGLEADFGAMPLSLGVGGSANTLNPGLYNASAPDVYDVPSVFTVQAKASTDWLATARVRAGFLPAPNLLVYGTVGIAATELTVSNAYSDNFNDTDHATGNVESSSANALRAGFVFGAGAEWAAGAHWKLRAEYLHTEFGALSTTGLTSLPPELSGFNPITSTANLRADLFRVGVAYGF